MLLNKVHIIVNPASGQDEPILAYLNNELHNKVDWDISLTHQAGDAKIQAITALEKGVDAVVVYGGDGTIMEVAEVLNGKDIPLGIISGGTANIMAKELGIPIASPQAVKLLTSAEFDIKTVDIMSTNSHLHLLRTSVGVLADMVTNTNREQKKQLGQLAYGVTALQKLSEKKQTTYTMILDGNEIVTTGEGLLIANSGNVGITGMSLFPNVSVVDGLLDIILIRNTDVLSILTIASNTLMKTTAPEDVITHWKAKEVLIRMDNQQTIVCDDLQLKTNKLNIQVVPHSLKVIVPKPV